MKVPNIYVCLRLGQAAFVGVSYYVRSFTHTLYFRTAKYWRNILWDSFIDIFFIQENLYDYCLVKGAQKKGHN